MASPIRITLFGGIIPRLSERGLPDNAAQFALNAKLYSGELRAWNQMRALDTLPISNAATVYHYRHLGLDKYLAFPTVTKVVKAPLVNEALGRLYWTPAAGGARMNTTARIQSGSPDFPLGLPAPGGTFTVTPTGGTSPTAETRSYVAIWVSIFGEEGPASNPVLVSGNADGTWTVDDLDTLTGTPGGTDILALEDDPGEPIELEDIPGDLELEGGSIGANIYALRLYRTLTSATGVDYRMVEEWPIGSIPSSWVDNVPSTGLSSAPVLQSLSWIAPPVDLKGLISVAGGFLAGFSGRTVRLSVPYYPHAWPEEYSFAVDDEIVGLGTFGNTVVICTQGVGQLLFGQTPDVMALQKMEGVQPCLSAQSIVSTAGAVMFATTDGLAAIDGSSNRATIISKAWVTRDEWLEQFSPGTQKASVYQDRYFCFYSNQLGFTIGFDDPISGFTELQLLGVNSVDLDTLTGDTLISVGNTVYAWDGDLDNTLQYTWKSKPFMQPKPVNYGVIQVRADYSGANTPIPAIPAQGSVGATVNSRAMGGGRPPLGTPFSVGGSINGPADFIALGTAAGPALPGPEIAAKLYVDDVLYWLGTFRSEDFQRLPSTRVGVKFEVELQGNSSIWSVVLADTAKMLEAIP